MQFETERKAQDFIKWNSGDFLQGGETLRPYYCKGCCCWHISHKKYSSGYGTQLEGKMEAFRERHAKSSMRLDKLIRGTITQTAIHQAEEIYPQLDLEYRGRSSIKKVVSKFLKEHTEYQDSSALREEINRLDRKRKQKAYL